MAMEDDPLRAIGLVVVWCAGSPRCASRVLRPRQTLGRDSFFDGQDARLSARHLELVVDRGVVHVTDLGSRNRTFVDGREVTRASLRPPFVLRAGQTVALVVEDAPRYAKRDDLRVGDRIVGPRQAEELEKVARAARGERSLLIEGETGTGKEETARAYHAASRHSRGAFVVVSGPEIPSTLAEARLFGVEKGAYSGADKRQLGCFERANGGTLFLDEIGDLPFELQGKLLRALETRRIERVGGSAQISLDLGVVAATNVALRRAVREGRFREDLFRRLAQREVTLPPLRERREEIPWLVAKLLAPFGKAISAPLIEECLLRRWTGNVRELGSTVEVAAEAAERAEEIGVRHLPAREEEDAPHVSANEDDAGATLMEGPPVFDAPAAAPKTRDEVRRGAEEAQRAATERMLRECGGNVAEAARRLGVERTTLASRMKRWGMLGG